MADIWVTDKTMPAQLDANRSVVIPPGEEVEVAHYFGNGNVRIFWKKSNEGFGGLTVTETDLESCAHAVRNG
jgi:hypothetical protein